MLASRSERHYRVLVSALLVFALALRLLGLDKGVWFDEFLLVDAIAADDFLGKLRDQVHPPLFYLPYRLWSHINDSEPFLRLVSVAFGMGTVAAMIVWMQLYSTRASLVAGMITASLPILLRYSQELRGYPLLLLATVSSFWIARRLIDEPQRGRHYICLGLTLSIAASAQLVGVFLAPSVAAYIALSSGRDVLRLPAGKALLTLAAPCMLCAFFAFFFLDRVASGISTHWMPPVSGGLLVGASSRILQPELLFFPQLILRNHAPPLVAPYGWAIGVLLATFLVGVGMGSWRRSLPLLAAAIAYWSGLAVYSVLAEPNVFWFRTALPGLIPFIGFVAVQLATVGNSRLRGASIGATAVLCAVFAVVWSYNKAWYPPEKWKQLVQTVREERAGGDLVVFFPSSIEKIARYHLPELSAEEWLAVDRSADVEELRFPAGQRAHMIVRREKSIRDGKSVYALLRSRLEQQFGPRVRSRQFGVLTLFSYEAEAP